MRAKIRSVIALLLSVVVVMSSLLPGVSAAAPVATPTDAEQSGTVVFVPESVTHSDYKPEAMGAYGVVYEIYDSDDRKAGEFALSYDGKAYVDADGEDYVYSQEEKSFQFLLYLVPGTEDPDAFLQLFFLRIEVT